MHSGDLLSGVVHYGEAENFSPPLVPKQMSLFAFKITTFIFWFLNCVCYLNMKEIPVNVGLSGSCFLKPTPQITFILGP